MGASSRLDDPRSPEALVYRQWYGTMRWKRRRRGQIRAQPFCEMCLEQGIYTAATVADHVEPHGGDPQAFWHGDLQSLCKLHHDRDKKLIEAGLALGGVDDDGWPSDPRHVANGGTGTLSREAEARRFPTDLKPSAIPLTIVCGRPGSGKSTYVADHAGPGDLIIDLDAILADLSGLPVHHPSQRHLPAALEERNRQLRALHTLTGPPSAWFVVTAGDPHERRKWAQRLGGEMVVIDTPLAECIRRIRADPGRQGRAARMIEAAKNWR